MSTREMRGVRVHNARRQPVELHLPGRTVVLAPAGSADLDPAELSCPQVQVLVRHRLIRIEEVAGEPAASEQAAEPSAPSAKRRPPRGPANVQGDK